MQAQEYPYMKSQSFPCRNTRENIRNTSTFTPLMLAFFNYSLLICVITTSGHASANSHIVILAYFMPDCEPSLYYED